ncbi:14767_t:CDS:2 [Funneliformis geosporum]|uniref:9682_t:CDS:1 n=1 Tax=Funneliformis geosporum TaxID=1117311 RepID=A0A9W4SWQ0_9GLOM|nr:14767_t:CDS:2 [Funneliformis geosporum]CAI2183366.1 9682_t:CDS:2 [Funneliformis geosporum]
MNLELFIRNKLFALGLHEETFGEYIAGIITDESLEESEKREAISEFISGATDKPSESIIDDIFKARIEFEKEEQKTKEADEKLKQEQEPKECEDAALQHNYEHASTSIESTTITLRNPKKQLTKEERKRREQLLARYNLLQTNRNAEQVKQKEQFRREQMRKQHEEEKERNRKLLEKQQEDKEKAKRKTMKREKRSW